jgi:hypothetical protein
MNRKGQNRQITNAVASGEPIYEVAKRFKLTPLVVGRIFRANGGIRPRKKPRPEVEGSVLPLGNLATWCRGAQHLDVAYVTARSVRHSGAMRAYINRIGPFPGKRFVLARSGKSFKIICMAYRNGD